MGKFLQPRLIIIFIVITLSVAGGWAAASGQWLFASILLFAVLLSIALLCFVSSRQLLNQSRMMHDETLANTRGFVESVSTSMTRIEQGLYRNETELSKNRQIVRSHQDEVAEVREKLGALEKHILVSREKMDIIKKETTNGIRESERRLTKNVSKPIEVRRAHERIEAAERRILGSLETQFFSQGVTLSEQTGSISALSEGIAQVLRTGVRAEDVTLASTSATGSQMENRHFQGMLSKINQHVTATARDSTRQIEALVQLASHFTDKKLPMPSTGGYAIDSQALGHLLTLIEERRPRRIVELGSGTSSVWVGYQCRNFGAKIVTLDHLREYFELTQAAVNRHHLNDHVECRLAPLEDRNFGSESFSWYSAEAFKDLSDIDMLIIDGPPESTGKSARYPALPEFIDLLAPNATVILDDAHREDESVILNSWLETFPEFVRVDIGASRLGVLERNR